MKIISALNFYHSSKAAFSKSGLLFVVAKRTQCLMTFLPDGGRLQQEIAYNKRILGEAFGSTSEIILQTGDHILTPSSLLLHYEAVKAATKVKVHVKNTYVNK